MNSNNRFEEIVIDVLKKDTKQEKQLGNKKFSAFRDSLISGFALAISIIIMFILSNSGLTGFREVSLMPLFFAIQSVFLILFIAYHDKPYSVQKTYKVNLMIVSLFNLLYFFMYFVNSGVFFVSIVVIYFLIFLAIIAPIFYIIGLKSNSKFVKITGNAAMHLSPIIFLISILSFDDGKAGVFALLIILLIVSFIFSHLLLVAKIPVGYRYIKPVKVKPSVPSPSSDNAVSYNRQVANQNQQASAPNIANLQVLLDRALASDDFEEARRLKERIDYYKSQGIQNQNQNNNVVITSRESYFDGYLIQLIGWKILAFIVNVCTLFLLYPITICWKLKWRCKHTVYDGKRLTFDGNGLQLLGRWILWMILSVITIGIYLLFIPIRIEKWKAKHTHLVDDYKRY